jgi:hypothetical protein
MAFINNGTTVISFAEYQDVVDRDSRLFDTNESLSEDVVEPLLERATERILTKMRSTSWWFSYYAKRDTTNTTLNTSADIPALDPERIKARQNDFTDLCVYTALSEFILPKIADFGTEDNAERQKMGYYAQKSTGLFDELISAGDWYDFDDSGTIASGEKSPGYSNLRRVR